MAQTTPPGWVSLVVTALCRGLLVMVASMALWALLPAALGWQVTVVMSGSMEPALRPGDVVASRPISGSAVRPGQVVLVDDPDHDGRLRMHRLSKVLDDGRLVLRGDANRTDDSTPVSRKAVHAVGSLRVPIIGAPAYWLRTHQLGPLIPTVLGVALVVLGAIRRHDWPADEGDPPDGDGEGGTLPTGTADGMASLRAEPVLVESRAQLRALRTEAARQHRPFETPARPSRAPQGAIRGRRKSLVILTTAALTVAAVATDAPAQAASAFRATTIQPVSSWSAVASFCKAAVLSDKPYLYYPFSEKSGSTASDASGNGRNGTYNTQLGAGVSYGATGPCALDGVTGVTLDGSNGWISTPGSFAAPATFTTEIWFRTTTTRGGALVGFRDPGLLGILLPSYDRQLYLDNSGRLVFGIDGSPAKTMASQGTYNDGNWHLADVTFSAGSARLYVDGAQAAESTTMTNPKAITGSWCVGTGNFSGWGSAPTSLRPAASVQGAAVYPTALSAAQVAAHYATHYVTR